MNSSEAREKASINCTYIVFTEGDIAVAAFFGPSEAIEYMAQAFRPLRLFETLIRGAEVPAAVVNGGSRAVLDWTYEGIPKLANTQTEGALHHA